MRTKTEMEAFIADAEKLTKTRELLAATDTTEQQKKVRPTFCASFCIFSAIDHASGDGFW